MVEDLYSIVPLNETNAQEACDLAIAVFEQFEGPSTPPEGLQEFRSWNTPSQVNSKACQLQWIWICHIRESKQQIGRRYCSKRLASYLFVVCGRRSSPTRNSKGYVQKSRRKNTF